MIVRQTQIESLDDARRPAFEDFMVGHLRDFTPLHSEGLGEAGIRTLIKAGVERAARHEFIHRGAVKFYIETMILLGADFDTDPQYPGARAALAAPAAGELERADRLHQWVMELLEKVGGPDRRFAKEALGRARKLPLEGSPVASPNFAAEAVRRMKETHPEKVAYLGEPAVAALVPRAIEEAGKRGVSTDLGVCLFLGLMFAVGHGFVEDPKYPWVLATLTNPAITDPAKRVERLYSKTMTYLDRVLENLGRQ